MKEVFKPDQTTVHLSAVVHLPIVCVILVLDSSAPTAALLPRFCAYVSLILDRLSELHGTQDIGLAQITYTENKATVFNPAFLPRSHVLSVLQNNPLQMGIGQSAIEHGRPMATVDGIITALEVDFLFLEV